ncbi:tetratricopeptide repeat protein, partial [bacterium]|nr:tetratricopeptide repeat protein [bacterium]
VKRVPIWILVALMLSGASLVCAQEATEEERLFAYCDRLYQLDDAKIYPLAQEEFQKFLDRYPDSFAAPEAQYKIGNLYTKRGEKLLAVANHMKNLYLYPEDSWAEKSRQEMLSIVPEKGKDRELRAKMATDVILKTEPTSARHFRYLEHLYRFEEPNLYQFTYDQFQEFLKRYPGSEEADLAQLKLAHLVNRQKLLHQAIAQYLKVVYLYPASLHVADARYKVGCIYHQEFKDYKHAVEAYQKVVNEHPESEWAENSLWNTAEIYAKELKEYGQAIRNYELFARRYPKTKRAQDSLYNAALLYRDETGDYAKAIQRFSHLAEKYPASRYADYALVGVAKIYEEKLKDFQKAIEAYQVVPEEYPASKYADDCLYQIGRIYEEELKSKAQAIEAYEKLTKKYPESRYSKKAQRKLKKLK